MRLKHKLASTGALCLVAIAVIVVVVLPKHVSGAATARPPDVDVAEVEQKDVALNTQVTGYLLRQDYKEGALVRKGQLLFEIDPRPFQAALNQAQGQLAQARAQLANAEAVQRRTQLDVERYIPLAKEQAASQQDLDNAVQNNLAAKATVATAEAQIQTAEAAVETAKLNLGFTRLISPIDGIAGEAQLQIGALVSTSSNPVTTVSTVDPIKVYFTVSEREYLDFNRRFLSDSERAAQLNKMPLALILADGTTYQHPGSIYFAERAINQGTGAIRIAGLFPNPRNILRPGGYGKVRAATRVQNDALLVPQRAVAELQGTFQVALVDGENKVSIQTIEVGPQVGTRWIIEKGLKPGQRVIVDGAQKVRPGMRVNPKPFALETTEAKAR